MCEKGRVEKGLSKVEWDIREGSGKVHKMLKNPWRKKK